jgi:hypothetical protein
VILDGHAYGICTGAPNPAEFELIDPPSGGKGTVIGVSGYDGSANIKLSVGTAGYSQPARCSTAAIPSSRTEPSSSSPNCPSWPVTTAGWS